MPKNAACLYFEETHTKTLIQRCYFYSAQRRCFVRCYSMRLGRGADVNVAWAGFSVPLAL
jgi:hypothetical protein